MVTMALLGFHTATTPATTTATTTAVTQMGNDSETEGVDVNTSSNREGDVDCNETTARRGLLDEPVCALYSRLEEERPWLVDECKLVNADNEVLEYALSENMKGGMTDIISIQLCRNLYKLIKLTEFQSLSNNPEHSSLRANVLEELAHNMDLPSDILNLD